MTIEVLKNFALVLFTGLYAVSLITIALTSIWMFIGRYINMHRCIEQHMAVKMFLKEGFTDLEDDRRFVIIKDLQSRGLKFGDACKFLDEIRGKLESAALETRK